MAPSGDSTFRSYPTALDWAALADIGWQVNTPPALGLTLNGSSTVVAFGESLTLTARVLGNPVPTGRVYFRTQYDLIGAAPLIVSAAGLLPGTLPGVIAVAADESCPRDEYRYRDGIFYASPYPRSIPGVPVERNLHGASFAVANITGFLARFGTRDALIAQAANNP